MVKLGSNCSCVSLQDWNFGARSPACPCRELGGAVWSAVAGAGTGFLLLCTLPGQCLTQCTLPSQHENSRRGFPDSLGVSSENEISVFSLLFFEARKPVFEVSTTSHTEITPRDYPVSATLPRTAGGNCSRPWTASAILFYFLRIRAFLFLIFIYFHFI